MTFVFCCCCRFLKWENTSERQSLLHPVTQASPTATAMEKRTRMTPKRMGVPEIDQAFVDIAETFNRQQEHYKTMTECLTDLRGRYRCSHGDGLSVCMRNIRDEHTAYSPSLQMKGYDFSLVLPPGPVPKRLQETQQRLRAICLAAKAITETSTKLQEMIDWVLQCEAEFAQQVGNAALTYLDQRRVEANLRQNMEEARRARDLSQKYRHEAGDLMKEVAQLSGVNLAP
ncbi:uncharacterized protein si:ch73-345f18.3 [Brienomyrus brachyistius]|uniref:uncharacterized protein si:ch73-345f18.3 n=1 Tax=Brienomyrus brachyistius TaxID=42636 RepID=UPI0020B30D18|nr:uncharacterized protein si:ch73-345f18.3 [Brienomyrus brachyistius]